ncbi:hypothetical protein Chor_007194 [Crotalus horridus]
MRTFHNDHEMVCKYIVLDVKETEGVDPEDGEKLRSDPIAMKVVNKLKEEEEQNKQEVARQLMPLTKENLRMFNNAQNNRIPPAIRQFACQPCDQMWWRQVPERKQVIFCTNPVGACEFLKMSVIPIWCPVAADVESATIQCHTIKCGAQQSLNAPHVAILSGDQLRWGHHLLASNVIHPYFQALSSHLESTQDPEADSSILALQRIATTDQPGAWKRSCCYLEKVKVEGVRKQEPHIPGTHCVHPRSRVRNRLPKVLCPSEEHDSTGSTVATCISQGSLACSNISDLILEDLKEQDEENDSEGSN